MPAFTVRIFKAFGSASNKPWVNTYVFGVPGTDPLAGDVLVPATATSIVNTIVAAEKLMHWSSIYFVRGTISTFVPDSVPYNPAGLITIPLTGTGNGGSAVDPTLEDLRIVLGVNRGATFGRPGRLFFRGCLTEASIMTSGGRMAFDPNGSAAAAAGNYITGMASLLTPGTEGGLQMTIVSGTATSILVPVPVRRSGTILTQEIAKIRHVAPFTQRAVTALTPGGPTIVSMDHRYFDKAA